MIKMLLAGAVPASYLAGALSILSFLALFIFFAGVPAFGPINDALSILLFLALIPAFLAWHELLRPQAPALLAWLTAAAVVSLLLSAATQLIFLVRIIAFEQTLQVIMPLSAVLGAWWIVSGGLSIQQGAVPFGLALAALICGAAFIVIALAFQSLGQNHPVTALGFIAGAVALPAWATWLARLLQSRPGFSLAG